MAKQRITRINSLLKEVISDIIKRDVCNPSVNQLMTVTRVEISPDLHYAKVYVSVIGSEAIKEGTLSALQSAAGFIAIHASKEVVMRYFPTLTFILDKGVDKRMRIEKLLSEIKTEREGREGDSRES